MVVACTLLTLALVTALAFSPVLTAGLVSHEDADALRTARMDARSWRDTAEAFTRIETPPGTSGYYRPLTAVSFAIDARLGSNPVARIFQAHLTNLLLHVINTVLLFGLLRRILVMRRASGGSGGKGQSDTASWLWPALLALLFALHPLQVESVAWLAQRMTLLATCFSLLTFGAYVRYRATDRIAWLFAAYATCAAAVLSNPTFMGLPIFLMVMDLWLLKQPLRRPALARVPFLLILAAAATVQFLIFVMAPVAASDVPPPLELVCVTMASFVARIFRPVDLLPMYPLGEWGASSHLVIGRDLVLASLLVLIPVWAFSRSRALFTALIGGLLFVCPAFLDAPFSEQRLGDHYLYPALIPGLIVLAAWIGGRREPFPRPIVRCAAFANVAVLALLAVTSYSQTFIWQNGRELHHAIVKKHPQWAPGYIGLIESLLDVNELDEAVQYARKAVEIAPHHPTTQFYLGTTLLLQTGGRAAEAIAPLRKALASNPQWIECLQNLGVALARCGHYDRAVEYLERARDAQPNSAGIRLGLGNAYLKLRRPSSARRELQEALRLKNDSVTHLSLAMAWAVNDEPERARRHLEAAIAKDPGIAARAAASEELQRFRDRPGFEDLFDSSADPKDHRPSDAELPAARSTRGS
jgi:protein O-mannosyl-transferase